jgi:hypothetical protein
MKMTVQDVGPLAEMTLRNFRPADGNNAAGCQPPLKKGAGVCEAGDGGFALDPSLRQQSTIPCPDEAGVRNKRNRDLNIVF